MGTRAELRLEYLSIGVAGITALVALLGSLGSQTPIPLIVSFIPLALLATVIRRFWTVVVCVCATLLLSTLPWTLALLLGDAEWVGPVLLGSPVLIAVCSTGAILDYGHRQWTAPPNQNASSTVQPLVGIWGLPTIWRWVNWAIVAVALSSVAVGNVRLANDGSLSVLVDVVPPLLSVVAFGFGVRKPPLVILCGVVLLAMSLNWLAISVGSELGKDLSFFVSLIALPICLTAFVADVTARHRQVP